MQGTLTPWLSNSHISVAVCCGVHENLPSRCPLSQCPVLAGVRSKCEPSPFLVRNEGMGYRGIYKFSGVGYAVGVVVRICASFPTDKRQALESRKQ